MKVKAGSNLEESVRKILLTAFVLFSLIHFGCADKALTGGAAPGRDAPAAVATAGTPALEVPESHFNFGEVSEGNDYVHEFVIRNRGTGVLEIKKVTPG